MLKESLKKTANLLDAGQYFPKRMIILAAEKEPEKVMALFKNLYDLSVDVKDRIKTFQAGVETIVCISI